MKHYLTYLKDSQGDNYLGIKINQTKIDTFLEKLKDILGDKFDKFRNNQIQRDNGTLHITVINVSEYNRKSQELGIDKFINSIDSIMKVDFDDIRFMGLGKVQKNENSDYFVIVRSELLEEVREKYDLEPKDFHITLGFFPRDIHGVRKNEIFNPTEPFLKKLKKEYLKEGETFEFVKGIKNFNLDFFKQIEPINIDNTSATFRCGDSDYITVSLIEDQFYITCKWQDEKKLPILSDVLINKKFKEI
jgi:hypothetical protein